MAIYALVKYAKSICGPYIENFWSNCGKFTLLTVILFDIWLFVVINRSPREHIIKSSHNPRLELENNVDYHHPKFKRTIGRVSNKMKTMIQNTARNNFRANAGKISHVANATRILKLTSSAIDAKVSPPAWMASNYQIGFNNLLQIGAAGNQDRIVEQLQFTISTSHDSTTKLILLANRIGAHANSANERLHSESCHVTNCLFTTNQSTSEQADAIVFDDLHIYSNYLEQRNPHQVGKT